MPSKQRKRVTQPSIPPTPRWGRALAGTVLFALTLAAYVPAMRGGFVWDDDDYVTRNQTLRTLDGLRRIWIEPGAVPQYYPLTHTSFWLEHHAWGLNPLGYHCVNVALHALNAVLLWGVLSRLAVPGAWLAALIFALHPVHVESVAWITERKNVLSGAWYLAALLAYFRFARIGYPAPKDDAHPWRWYAASLGLFVGALLSKTVTCTLPVALLLVHWWKRSRIGGREAGRLLPFFAIGAALGLVTVAMEAQRVGAVGKDWDLSVVDRCLIAGRALWFYAGKLVWPQTLTFIYPRWRIDSGEWWQYVFPLAATAAVGGLFWNRQRVGAGPLVGVLFFAVSLAPALGFVNVFPMRYSFVADHFQYLASIGLIALATGVATALCRRAGERCSRIGAAAAAVVALALGVLAWQQAYSYQNLETLWRDTLAKNPEAGMAHNNLGLLLAEQGKLTEAMSHYEAALRLQPDDAFALNNLGNAYAAQGRMPEAISRYAEAARVEPGNAEARNNLGNALAAQGRLGEAHAQYLEAVRLKPRYADARSNLGNVLAAQGRTEDAVAQYGEALRIDPNFAAAHHNLGVLLAAKGNTSEAMAHYREALRIDPAYAQAHASLATALASQGKFEEAIAEFDIALRLRPDDPHTRQQLEAVRAGRR